MTKVIDFKGQEITFEYLSNGLVLKCSNWGLIDALADAGHLTRKSYGSSTYGHTDFFIA